MTRVNISVDKSVLEDVDSIVESAEYADMNLSRQQVIRMVFKQRAREVSIGKSARPSSKGDISDLTELIKGLSDKIDGQPVRASSRSTKATEQMPSYTEQRAICERLGGVVDEDGHCVYDKYDVTTSGRPIKPKQHVPLSELTEENVLGQWNPSRKGWEDARQAWDIKMAHEIEERGK